MEKSKDSEQRCAPGVDFKDGSCIELELLISMVKAYNEINTNQADQIKLQETVTNPGSYKKYLLGELTKKTNVDKQRDWLKEEFVRKLDPKSQEKLVRNTWRAEGPQGKFEWLNTLHIDDVMAQYEKIHPEFIFLGAVPIDFDDLPELGIKNLSFQSLLDRGKSKIGIIFNLDRHDQSGSHWVASYADLLKNQVYFFDSYGIEPVQQIKTYMDRIVEFCRKINGKVEIDEAYNTTQHQRQNSECGVYCLYFIIKLLGGKKAFKDFLRTRIPDNFINKCRDVYFVNTNVNT